MCAAGYRIPATLQIKPTDNEEQKRIKRKKIHSLKAKQKDVRFAFSLLISSLLFPVVSYAVPVARFV